MTVTFTFPAFLLRFCLRARPYRFYVSTGRFATIRPLVPVLSGKATPLLPEPRNAAVPSADVIGHRIDEAQSAELRVFFFPCGLDHGSRTSSH